MWPAILVVALLLVGAGYLTVRHFGEAQTLARTVGDDVHCSEVGTQLIAGERKTVYDCTWSESDSDRFGCFALVDGDAYAVNAWAGEGGSCRPPSP